MHEQQRFRYERIIQVKDGSWIDYAKYPCASSGRMAGDDMALMRSDVRDRIATVGKPNVRIIKRRTAA